MGVKFNRRIKLAKGVNLNIGKKGVNSISFKVGKTTINPTKNTFSYNSSIKGVSYQGKLVGTNDTKKANDNIDIVNNINGANSCCSEANDIKQFEDLKKIKVGMETLESTEKSLMVFKKCLQNFTDDIEKIEKEIEKIKNDKYLTEQQREYLLSKAFAILRESINSREEAIQSINKANNLIEDVEKEISFIENKYNISRYHLLDMYNNRYAINNNINNSSDGVVGFMFCIVGIIFLCILFSL